MDYSIVVLLATNIWIFTYRFLIGLLNQNFPARQNPSFIVPGVNPEPFEIPLYIALTIAITLAIYLVYRYRGWRPKLVKQISFRYRPLIKWSVLILLIIIFLRQLGDFPLNRLVSQYPFITPFIKRLSLMVMAAYTLLVILIIVGVTKLYGLTERKGKSLILIYALLVLIIGLLTFEPGFPIFYLDYAPFFGPILEIANGKTIYTEISSHYGFLSILIPAFLVKMRIFNITYLPFLIWFLYIFQYYIFFYLVFKITRSLPFSLVCLFSVITLNYFSLIHPPISVPQIGAMRWSQMVLAAFAFYKLKNIHSKLLIFLLAFFSLFIIDSGIAITAAYILTLFFLLLKKQTTWRKTLASSFYFFASLALLFTVINLILLVTGYKLIDAGSLFTKINQYARYGVNMLPMPYFTYFWFVILFYFASMVYFFKKEKPDALAQLVLLTAQLSFLGSIYYVGRSHPNNLMVISILPLFNLSTLLAVYYHKISSRWVKFALCSFMFFFFIIIPAFNRRVSLSYIIYLKINRLGVRLYEGKLPQRFIYQFCKPERVHIFDTEIEECVLAKYRKEKEFINQNMADEEIVILSPDDTYLFYLTGKKNMLKVNPQASIFTKGDLDFATEEAVKRCPKKIIVDPRVFGKDSIETLNFYYTVQPNLLEKIEEGCEVEYVKSLCTEKLCIAEASSQ